MGQAQMATDFYTPEEYLHLEEQALEKSEYYNGEIFKMDSSTLNHNQITGNLCVELQQSLKTSPYRLFALELKLWIPQKQSFVYPDVMVIEGEPEFYDNRKDVILNPVIVIEVLSDSTRDYDKSGKFEHYRSLDSLQEYILIEQYQAHVEYYRKTAPNEWLFKETDGLESSFNIATLNTRLELADIYTKIDFT